MSLRKMQVMDPIIKAVFLATAMLTLSSFSQATKETPIPVNDEGEGSLCDQDQRVANVCLACSVLPFHLNVPLTECCSDESKIKICKVCVNNQKSCIKMFMEDAGKDVLPSTDLHNMKIQGGISKIVGNVLMKSPRKILNRQKRFGRLFIKSPNRYRRWFGKRDGSEIPDVSEFMDDGDKWYGDNADRNLGDLFEMPEKRYGHVYFGNGGYFKKFGKRDENEVNMLSNEILGVPDKKYGRLYIGSGWKFGKRAGPDTDFWDEYVDTPDKRYGRLFVGSGGRYYGKRDNLQDMEKRYGRLFVGGGSYFGKRSLDDFTDDYISDADKRFGRLFIGSGGYFGKRDGTQNLQSEYDFTDSLSGSALEDDDSDLTADKRFGRLFVGGRSSRFFKNYMNG